MEVSEKKMGSPKIIQTGLFLLGNCKNQWFGTWDVHILGNLHADFFDNEDTIRYP